MVADLWSTYFGVVTLAAKTLPGLQRSVKWGMAYYGVGASTLGRSAPLRSIPSALLGGGWCFASGAFVGHLKVMFIRGTDLKPEPPVTPVAMGKAPPSLRYGGQARGVSS